MRIIKLLLISFCLSIFNSASAQRIKGVKTLLEKNDYGNWHLRITPNVFDMKKSKNTKSTGVYALKICYKVKDKEKQVYQDITYDFLHKKEKLFYIASSYVKENEINIVNITFFRKDFGRENWPKLDCFKE